MIDRKKFVKEWLANATSLAMLAITGVLLNSLITKSYGTAALGIFNQVYAVFVFASQIATFGVQFSVLRHIADVGEGHLDAPLILNGALVLVTAFATATVTILLCFFWLFGTLLFSTGVVVGVTLMLPGLWCFALNKVLLNAFNAIQANTLYAVFVAVRYLLVLLFLLASIAIGLRGEQLGLILSGSEGMLLVGLAIACLWRFPGVTRAAGTNWLTVHRAFGMRSMTGEIALELNSRVDVLVLGLFATDTVVGVYSFAAFFVDGLMQLTIISRRLVDPILTRLVNEDLGQVRTLLSRGRNVSAVTAAVLGIGAIATYPLYAAVAGTHELAMESWPVFVILMLGACVFAVYATFGGIFSQTGRPVVQSRLSSAILLINLGLNFAMVPSFGLIGAAVATALSYIAGTVYFRSLVRRHLAVTF